MSQLTRSVIITAALCFHVLASSSPAADETAYWLGGSGDWADPAKWSTADYPHNNGTTYDAVIDASAGSNPYVTLASNIAIDKFVLNSSNGVLNLMLNTLSLVGTEPSQLAAGTLNMNNSTIVSGQIDLTGGRLGIQSSGWFLPSFIGTFDGTILNGDLILTNPGQVTLKNGAQFTGTACTLNNNILFLDQDVNWAGKIISMDGDSMYTSQQAKVFMGDGKTLTLDSSTVIRSGNAQIGSTYSSTVNDRIENSGHMISEKSRKRLVIGGNTMSNQGVIEAENTGQIEINSKNWTNEPTGQIVAQQCPEIWLAGDVWQNNGTISLTDSTAYFQGQWSNNGSLIMENSTVSLNGDFTTAGMGIPNWSRTGGEVRIAGTLDNTAATLSLADTGSLVLMEGTIRGGTIIPDALNSLKYSSGKLDGVILEGDLVFYSGGQVCLTGGTSFTGNQIKMQGNQCKLEFDQDMNLSNTSVELAGTIDIYAGRTMTWGPGATLTLNSELGTISGDGHLECVAPIALDGSAKILKMSTETLTSRGTIQATNSAEIQIHADEWQNTSTGTLQASSGGTLSLAGRWSNAGDLVIDGGKVILDGEYSFVDMGIPRWQRNGGEIQLRGTLDNIGTVLNLDETGPLILRGGTIRGGEIRPSSINKMSFGNLASTLDGATLYDDLILDSGARLTLKNGATFTGDNVSINGYDTRLIVSQDMTLSGKTLTLTGENKRAILAVDTGCTVEISNDTVITGHACAINGADPCDPVGTVNNLGTIRAIGPVSQDDDDFVINPDSLCNKGLMEATNGGAVYLAATNWKNDSTGILRIGSGSSMSFYGTWENLGTLIMESDCKSLTLGGEFTTAGMGMDRWQRHGGILNIYGTLDNTGDVLELDQLGPVYFSYAAKIKGGEVVPNSTGQVTGELILDGATLLGDIVMPNDGLYRLAFKNGATFTGDKMIIPNGDVQFHQDTNLNGMQIQLGGIISAGSGSTLTLGPQTTIVSDGGAIRQTEGGGTVVNEGTIVVQQNSESWFGGSNGPINKGTILITGNSTFWTGGSNTGPAYRQTGGITAIEAGATLRQVNGGEFFDIAGGVITGSGRIHTADKNGHFLVSQGILEPGNSLGTLSFITEYYGWWLVELTADSLLDYELGVPGIIGNLQNDLIDINGDLILDGFVDVTAMSGFGEGTYCLITYTGDLTNNGLDIGNMPSGFTGYIDISILGEVNLIVSEIPEPTTLGLLTLGGLVLTHRRRNRMT